ncbi:MAG TPA: MFS transporter [Candidatus Binatia bacterium]|nr:MFS transporter [Candidatus Binatia bacterium]
MTPPNSDSIWSRTFALLCLAQVFGYAQHFMLQPALPLYITQLGGTPFTVGLVLACFAVTSVIVRPLMGHWADRCGEAQVMLYGMLIQGGSVLICLFPSTGITMLANGLRGIGWAALNAGGYSMLAVIAPLARRGEAAGYYSGAQNSASIFFPAVALWLIDAPFGGYAAVFLSAAGLAFAGSGLARVLSNSVARVRALPPHSFTPPFRDLFTLVERDVLLPSSLHFFLQLTMPAITSFIVLYASAMGISGIGSFYVVSGITSMLARPLLGKVSDKLGRARSLAVAFVFQAVALSAIVTVSSLSALLICGMIYVLTVAIGSSTTLALAMERANPEHRGRSMASFSIAYPLSYGVGGLVAGAAVDLFGFGWMYLIMAGVSLLGLFITAASWSKIG